MNETETRQAIDLLNGIMELEHEQAALDGYYALLTLVEGGTLVLLEEYAIALIVEEELHLDVVNKMLRRQGG